MRDGEGQCAAGTALARDRAMKRRIKKPIRHVRADEDAPMPVLDKAPAERTPKEVREAIEHDALLDTRGEHSR
jgi:hypothetical protein